MAYSSNKETWENPNVKDQGCIHDNHVGGTEQGGDPSGWHPEVWDLLCSRFEINSMLDIGCGVGTSQLFFERNGINNLGIDGTDKVIPFHRMVNNLIIHDLTLGPFKHGDFDLVWSCDVFEHIEEKFIQNIFDTLNASNAKIIAFAAAPVGWGGYHHVNCQNPPYWIEKMAEFCSGYTYDEALTTECRTISPIGSYGRNQSFFQRSGLIFTKNK